MSSLTRRMIHASRRADRVAAMGSATRCRGRGLAQPTRPTIAIPTMRVLICSPANVALQPRGLPRRLQPLARLSLALRGTSRTPASRPTCLRATVESRTSRRSSSSPCTATDVLWQRATSDLSSFAEMRYRACHLDSAKRLPLRNRRCRPAKPTFSGGNRRGRT